LNVTPGELFMEGVSKPEKDMVMNKINRLLKGRSLKDKKIALTCPPDIFKKVACPSDLSFRSF